MKLSSSDFQMMRWNIAAISASLILSGIFLYASQQYADHANKDFRIAQSQLSEARNRVTIAHQDQENITLYSAEYDELEAHNIVGDDHRLDWMEGLEKLRNQNLALDFRYNIAPQKIFTPQPALDNGNFNIQYSEMKLQFDLLHEGQLVNFFAALNKQIKGYFHLESCTLHRDDIEAAVDNPAAHVKAECSGGWISLKNRNAQP